MMMTFDKIAPDGGIQVLSCHRADETTSPATNNSKYSFVKRFVMHHVTQPEDQQSHVSVGKCSHTSQQSDEELPPIMTHRNGTLPTQKLAKNPPVLRFTYNKDKTQQKHKYTSASAYDDDLDSSNQSVESPRDNSNQSDLRTVTLPRLSNSEQKCSSPSRNSDSERLKFPHINKRPRANAHLALNRSITDLLDPEMEILNKIKHIPKRKRRKRRQKSINTESGLTRKSEND